MICKNCGYDMGDNYSNCGSSPDGVCPECGQSERGDQVKYEVHLESISIDQEEYEQLKKIGFHDWIFEQAELRNIQYDYFGQK